MKIFEWFCSEQKMLRKYEKSDIAMWETTGSWDKSVSMAFVHIFSCDKDVSNK